MARDAIVQDAVLVAIITPAQHPFLRGKRPKAVYHPLLDGFRPGSRISLQELLFPVSTSNE